VVAVAAAKVTTQLRLVHHIGRGRNRSQRTRQRIIGKHLGVAFIYARANLDQFASRIVNANHSIVCADAKLCRRIYCIRGRDFGLSSGGHLSKMAHIPLP